MLRIVTYHDRMPLYIVLIIFIIVTIFKEKSTQYIYDKIFHFSPWKEIHKKDNERYESFEETSKIDVYLKKAYLDLGYTLIDVPFGSLKERTEFIINSLSCDL